MTRKSKAGRKKIDEDTKKVQVNLRLNPLDLVRLKEISERESIPYQTIIGSIVHKYVDGRFIEKEDEEIKIPRQREEMNNRQYNQRAC